MSQNVARIRRRSIVAAATLTLALTACDLSRPQGRESEPATNLDADAALVGSVVAQIDRTTDLLEATIASTPALAELLGALIAAHAAHRTLLEPSSRPNTAARPPAARSPRPAAALSAARRAERELSNNLTTATAEATSGDLARVLAVMNASLSQHLTLLDEAYRERTAR